MIITLVVIADNYCLFVAISWEGTDVCQVNLLQMYSMNVLWVVFFCWFFFFTLSAFNIGKYPIAKCIAGISSSTVSLSIKY